MHLYDSNDCTLIKNLPWGLYLLFHKEKKKQKNSIFQAEAAAIRPEDNMLCALGDFQNFSWETRRHTK
jgi:hypothetical protein